MIVNAAQDPKRIKVSVVKEEKLPEVIDLAETLGSTRPSPEVNQQKQENEPDWREKYLRLAAEVDNTKKRLAQTYARQAETEKERILLDFLEVADNLERASAHANASESGALREGIRNINSHFQQTLAKYDVRPFQALGQPFSPERHEAVSVITQADLPANTIVSVMQPGYRLGEKILRPARVVVSRQQ